MTLPFRSRGSIKRAILVLVGILRRLRGELSHQVAPAQTIAVVTQPKP